MSKLTETLHKLSRPDLKTRSEAIIKSLTSGKTPDEVFKKLTEEADPGLAIYGEESWKGMNTAWTLMSIGAAIAGGRRPLPNEQDPEQYKIGIEVEREHLPEMPGFEGFRDYVAEIIASAHWNEDPEYYYRDKNGKAKVKGEK